MPRVDPPWTEPQETQHCPRCEELAKRLAEAEELIRQYHECFPTPESKAFLSHQPTGYVVVKREDLEYALDNYFPNKDINWPNAIVNLKAVLEGK